jgi:UPF0755 protein
MSASRVVKLLIVLVILLLAIVGIKFLSIYKKAYTSNVELNNEEEIYVFIHTGWNYDSVYKSFQQTGFLKNIKTFNWTAKKKNYPNHIYPGRYKISNRMSNNELVNKLRSGNQDVVKLTFNNIKTLQELAENIAGQLEPSADEFYAEFTNLATQKKYGFNAYTLPVIFIPNTYELYWNTRPEQFIERMSNEYDQFWNNSRKSKAKKVGLNPEEVITLASIVEEETLKDDERPKVAGVYLNRLEINMRLQADPTVVFAVGDFSIRRVLIKHKKVKSPYNTYMNSGLPPGPICLPEISSIDAVLNFKKHKYLYFCAKPDFSGYHSFAKTYKEHTKNARAYQKELNKRRIYR